MPQEPESNEEPRPLRFADANDLFVVVMALQRSQFTAGYLDAAFHTLSAALHLADSGGSASNLLLVAARSEEDLRWIDANASEYFHSSASTTERGSLAKNIWKVLEEMAKRRARLVSAELRLQHMALPSVL